MPHLPADDCAADGHFPLFHISICELCRDRYARERIAAVKRAIPNARDTIRDRYAPEGGAGKKRAIPNARDAIRDCHAREGGAVSKRETTNAHDAGRDRIIPKAGRNIEQFVLLFVDQGSTFIYRKNRMPA